MVTEYTKLKDGVIMIRGADSNTFFNEKWLNYIEYFKGAVLPGQFIEVPHYSENGSKPNATLFRIKVDGSTESTYEEKSVLNLSEIYDIVYILIKKFNLMHYMIEANSLISSIVQEEAEKGLIVIPPLKGNHYFSILASKNTLIPYIAATSSNGVFVVYRDCFINNIPVNGGNLPYTFMAKINKISRLFVDNRNNERSKNGILFNRQEEYDMPDDKMAQIIEGLCYEGIVLKHYEGKKDKKV